MLASMKLSELPTANLLRALRAMVASPDADPYARRVLLDEVNRRLVEQEERDDQEAPT